MSASGSPPRSSTAAATGPPRPPGPARVDDGRDRARGAALFILIGARPHTDWLPEEVERDRWGYVLTGSAAGAGSLPDAWPRSARR